MSKARQFIQDYTRNCSNETDFPSYNGVDYQPWLTHEQALRAVEIANEELTEKAVEWLKKHLQGIAGGSIYIEDFKKYMKGE